tara:strand:+ start:1101 stop:1376 length:276 start_codon:yes stop_codon:yes gene_type:complete
MMESSKSLYFRDLSFKYTHNKYARLGLAVSKKYGNAVQRNLFKRQCRHLFHTVIVDNNLNFNVLVRPKKPNLPFKLIKESFNALYERLSYK